VGVTLADSYARCREITGRSHSSFNLGMRLFPRASRDGILAMYAFFRVTDDIVDAEGAPEEQRRLLGDWSGAVARALAGENSPTDAMLLAVADTARRYALPPRLFTDCIDACAEDIGAVRLPTWDALWHYCDGVAGTVGEACLRILGYAEPETLALSQCNARAVQLTNIVRDIAEDAGRDRVYLPADLLTEHGLAPDEVLADPQAPAVRAAARAAGQVAERHFGQAEALFDRLRPADRPPLVAMTMRYRRLLGDLAASDYAPGTVRRGSALGLLSSALMSRWRPTWRG